MQIYNSPINHKKNSLSFGDGQVNIIATSDNHGRIEALPDMYNKLNRSIHKIFPGRNQRSYVNVFMNVGDWFINPGKTGYLSDKKKVSADYQLAAMNIFLDEINKKVPGLKAFYTPGNHAFDDGDELVFKRIGKANINTIMSNVNFKTSSTIQNLPSGEKLKIKESDVIEVPDSKTPGMTHKVLVLGMTIPAVDFYTPNMVKGLDVIDRTGKKDVQIKEADLSKTYTKFNSMITKFKKDNPKGAVILMSHAGNALSKMVAQNVPDINIILNGHDHTDQEIVVKNKTKGNYTSIVSLYKNNEKFNSIKLHFNDNGDLNRINSSNYYTYISQNTVPNNTNNPVWQRLNGVLKEDMKPLGYISGPKDILKLSTKGIRKDNNYLANFVTDAIFTSFKKHKPETQIFGVLAANIRQSLPVNGWFNNLKMINLFSGQPQELTQIYTGKLKGSDLTKIVVENIGDNEKNQSRNPVVQYSGLQINMDKILSMIQHADKYTLKDYSKYIKIKAGENDAKTSDVFSHFINKGKTYNKTAAIFKPLANKQVKTMEGGYAPIDWSAEYNVAIPKGLFTVPNVQSLVDLKDQFKPTNHYSAGLFSEYLEANNSKVSIDKSVDNRIIKNQYPST